MVITEQPRYIKAHRGMKFMDTGFYNFEPKNFLNIHENDTINLVTSPKCTLCNSDIKLENYIHSPDYYICHQFDCVYNCTHAPYTMPLFIVNTRTNYQCRLLSAENTIEQWKKIPTWNLHYHQDHRDLKQNLLFHFGTVDLRPLHFEKKIL